MFSIIIYFYFVVRFSRNPAAHLPLISYLHTQPDGSTVHDASNTSPHTHWRPAIFTQVSIKMSYNLRARRPPRRDAFLAACYDTLPPEVLRRILLLRIAMPRAEIHHRIEIASTFQ